jgi:Ser/Thr protein kinase RdoA (MazF antagonist)
VIEVTEEGRTDRDKELFLSLTPQKVIAAVEASGVLCNAVCYPLNSFENRVYEVELESKERVVAKFYRPGRWTRAQILEEHAFLSELAEAEVPVCPPLKFTTQSASGCEFADGDTLYGIDHISYCLFPRRGGRAPDEIDDALAERLGRLVARVHNVGASKPAEHRLALSPDYHARQSARFVVEKGLVPKRLETRYLEASNRIAELAEERMNGLDVHRIHGDLHAGNLLFRDELLHVIDFDDMMVGPAIQDVWLLFAARDSHSLRLRDAFLDGYESLRSFESESLSLVEPLRGMRMIHYAAWIARRWHDPIFPRTFVHFGTEAYWEEQTRDLEEVVSVAEGGKAPRANNAPPDGEAPYFWDMPDKD